MLWLTSKPYHSPASVAVLGELHRLKTVIQMVKVAGRLNLQSSFWIYSRMLRVMQRYVSFNLAYLLFWPCIHLLTLFILYIVLTLFFMYSVGERLRCGRALHFSHPSESSPEAEASDLSCTWKD